MLKLLGSGGFAGRGFGEMLAPRPKLQGFADIVSRVTPMWMWPSNSLSDRGVPWRSR